MHSHAHGGDAVPSRGRDAASAHGHTFPARGHTSARTRCSSDSSGHRPRFDGGVHTSSSVHNSSANNSSSAHASTRHAVDAATTPATVYWKDVPAALCHEAITSGFHPPIRVGPARPGANASDAAHPLATTLLPRVPDMRRQPSMRRLESSDGGSSHGYWRRPDPSLSTMPVVVATGAAIPIAAAAGAAVAISAVPATVPSAVGRVGGEGARTLSRTSAIALDGDELLSALQLQQQQQEEGAPPPFARSLLRSERLSHSAGECSTTFARSMLTVQLAGCAAATPSL